MRAFLSEFGWAGVFATQAFVAGCGGSALTNNGQPDANATSPNDVLGDASSSDSSPGDAYSSSTSTSTALTDACCSSPSSFPDVATECTDRLDDLQKFARCPETYAVTGGAAQFCDAGARIVYFGSADGLAVASLTIGAGGSLCIYRSTDGALLGIQAEDDVPDYCNHTSNVETAGVQPPPGFETEPVDCSGGSRDAGDAGDGSAACTGDLNQLKTLVGCPAAYSTEAGIAQLCDAGGYHAVDVKSEDGGLAILTLLFGPGGSQCFYRSSDGALVGVQAASDEPDFCNGTSYTEWAGMQAPQGAQGTTVSCAGSGSSGTDSGRDATPDSSTDSGG